MTGNVRRVSNLRVVLFVLLAFSLLVTVFPEPFQEARATAPSRVYFNHPTVCCTAPGPSSFATFSVRMDLASGERINGYDVRVDYTNYNSSSSTVLDAQSMDPTGNIFGGQSATVLAYCADGISLLPQGNGCQTDDSPSGGQVHFSQLLVGTTLNGPVVNATLFSITFSVNETGRSLLTMDRANLLNPGPDQFPNPHYVQVATEAGVFGNTGIVPFFDYQPIPPPSVLPGQFIPFDASLGFNGSSGVPLTDASYGLKSADYSWDFGDSNPPQLDTSSGRVASHSFVAAGNFTVRLSVTIPSGSVWSFERRVFVYPFLGGLQITVKDQSGSPFRSGVRVSLYNSSQFTTPFENKTINAVGIVLFTGLSPGTYLARFSGSSLKSDNSTQLLVNAGWTSLETVYLAARIVSPPSIDTATIVYLAVIIGGIVVVVAVLLLQRRSRGTRRARQKLR